MRKNIIITIILMVSISPFFCFAEGNEQPTEREYVKLIEEGKTWEYIFQHNLGSWYTLTAFQMRFDGTETRNGIEYNKLVYCGHLTKWKAVPELYDDGTFFNWWENTPYDISSQPNDITAYFLMREDNGRVYLYMRDLIDGKINSEDIFDYYNQYPSIEEIGDEAIIYDFTKKTGECYENAFFVEEGGSLREIYPFVPARWGIEDLVIKSVNYIDLNGKEIIQQTIDDHNDYVLGRVSCLEGVGAINSGFLPYLDFSPILAGMENCEYYLNSLYKETGEIIFKDNKYIDVAKIIEMADVEQPVIGPSIARGNDGIKAEDAVITLFDLSGRMVVSSYETVSTISLQPGVYIAKAESPSGISTLKIRIE